MNSNPSETDPLIQCSHDPPSSHDAINGSCDQDTPEVTTQPVTYKKRWYILLLFSMMAFTQANNWNTWGPIATSAKFAYGWNNSMISLLAAWGPVFFMLTVFPFSWLMTTKGIDDFQACFSYVNLAITVRTHYQYCQKSRLVLTAGVLILTLANGY